MVTLCFKKRKALAQIPVLIGLFIMAVALPVATKLVQQNQDNRNRAVLVITPPPSGCTEGYVRCFNNIQQRCQNGSWVFQKNCPNGCSGNYCKVVPTSTPRPPTNTPKAPTATPTPIICKNGACTLEGSFKCSSNNQYRCDGECWNIMKNCPNGCLEATCAPLPTLTPTRLPPTSTPTLTIKPTPTLTPKPISYTCMSLGGSCVSYGCTCGTISSGTCQGDDECCRPCPTSTPRPPTSTPTRAPTATPTTACTGTCQYSDCLTMNMKTGVGFCPPPQYCCGEKILSYACNIGERTCLSDKSGVNICKPDRTGYTIFKCSEGRVCDPNTRTCVSLSSTLTPTNVEKVVCSSKVIGRCGPQAGCSFGYRCISGAGTFNCSYDPACGAFTATATPKPTATVTPVSSCIQENQTYQEGKCCPGLVRVKTPYGSICGKPGTCTPGSTKCDDSNKFVLVCDASGYFQKNQSCGGECKNGKCEIICTTGQTRCRDNKTLEVCNESGTSFTSQSCNYKCEYNKCVEKPMADVTPTPIDCLPGKNSCTGNKGMMECNSKGDGYNYFQCGILCIGGRCIGETITLGGPTNPTNCISGEIKCEATSNGGFSEFKCNSSGYWDEILSCASGCYYGRCKQAVETEGCLKENERYQEGKCCPGLVKVTSPYGYYCGKPGTCTPGTTKCENNSIWKCDTSGYFSKIKSCDFGCGENECNLGCTPRSTICRNEKTLLVCSDNGTAWLSRSCNYCSEGICFQSKKEAQENLAYSDTSWDGQGPLPYCYAPGAEEVGLNTCPQGYICGSQRVEDRSDLYYCEKKTVENSIVKACVANSSFCGQGGVLLRCSSDGMRLAAAWQCPAPRPEKGSQYNYSCKQVSTDRGECRPPTPEEGRDVAIEIVGAELAAVASVLAIPAVITNPAVLSTTFRIVRIGNAAYAINNAANECQSFESMTNDEKLKCVLAAGYAITATFDAGLAGAGIINPAGSPLLSGIEVTNDVANLALGGVNAYNQCQNGTDEDCYAALISSGIDLIALGADINQSKQWSKTNLKIEVEDLPKTITFTDEALTGTMFADDAAALSIYNKTYVSGGGQRLIIDPSRDQILAQTLVDSHTQINALRTSESISRVPLAQQYVTSLFPDYSRPTSTRASVNATVLIHDSIYEQFGETAFLGDFICSGSAVCREQSILLHTVLANEGKASQVVTGYLPAGKHAWVELIDSVTGQTMVVDSVWNFVKPQQEAYKIYGGVENLLRQTFVNP